MLRAAAGSAYSDDGVRIDTHCACGLPLHYDDPLVQGVVEATIRERGTHVIATIEGRAFAIPRHYLALHCAAGLDGLDPAQLGFAEITAAANLVR